MPTTSDYTVPATDNTRVPRRNQFAVYWPDPEVDDNGRTVYGPPAEIACRWSDVVEEFLNVDGDRSISRSKVFPDRDLEPGGVLWQGRLTDLGNFTEPFENDGAWKIQAWSKVPDTRGRKFLRIATL